MGDDLYGTDVLMTADGDIQAAPGGDLATVTGLANLNQAVTNRVLTDPDEYFFGEYGCTVKRYIDSVDPNIVDEIPQDVSASLLEDSRISSATVTASKDVDTGDTNIQITYVSAFGDPSSVEVTP